MNGLTHIDSSGNAIMVDVSDKNLTLREASASGKIFVGAEILTAITSGTSKKGDVLSVAQVAGIMAANARANLFRFVTRCQSVTVRLLLKF